tara:strand:+ start:1336 stop:2184 length:849 start_codon:yes stop_codon:yes gene_type:complete
MPQASSPDGNGTRLRNVTFPQARIDINDNFEALQTLNSGNSAPSTTAAHMLWLNTGVNPAVLNIRDATDNAWIPVGSVSSTLFKPLGVTDIANGGTGKTTKNEAIAELLPDQGDHIGEVLTTDGSTLSWGAGVSFARVLDQKSAGVGGGTSGSANNWHTRELTLTQGASWLTVSNNQFTLTGAGTYFIKFRSPGFQIVQFQAGLYDITNSTFKAYGSSNYANEGGWETNFYSEGSYVATQTGNVTYEIRMKHSGGAHGDGYGQPTGLSTPEIYTSVEVIKTS